MVRKRVDPPKSEPLRLIVPADEASEKLGARIEKGRELRERQIRSDEELETARTDYRKWDDYNTELLRQLFNTPELADQYQYIGAGVFLMGRDVYLQEEIKEFQDDVKRKLTRLESIVDRLEIIPAPPTRVTIPEPRVTVEQSKRIFVVHGRNLHIREAVARLLSRLAFDPVILHEQPNAGRTLIEKFETYADVPYAVVILTGDDVGGLAGDKPQLQHRARQNVIFELGFFVGKLGRKNVCALYEDGVEIPSDFQGVVFVPLDDGGAWKFRLATEMKGSGLDVDMNEVII